MSTDSTDVRGRGGGRSAPAPVAAPALPPVEETGPSELAPAAPPATPGDCAACEEPRGDVNLPWLDAASMSATAFWQTVRGITMDPGSLKQRASEHVSATEARAFLRRAMIYLAAAAAVMYAVPVAIHPAPRISANWLSAVALRLVVVATAALLIGYLCAMLAARLCCRRHGHRIERALLLGIYLLAPLALMVVPAALAVASGIVGRSAALLGAWLLHVARWLRYAEGAAVAAVLLLWLRAVAVGSSALASGGWGRGILVAAIVAAGAAIVTTAAGFAGLLVVLALEPYLGRL